MIIRTRSARTTERLGVQLGAALQPGDFVGLSGNLGAGKTVMARGIAQGAGVPEGALVSSPTFAIVNTYRGGRLPIIHADLYRVTDAEELYDAGFYDIGSRDNAMVVEWIDRVPAAAPADWLEVRLSRTKSGRTIEVIAHGSAGRLAQALMPG